MSNVKKLTFGLLLLLVIGCGLFFVCNLDSGPKQIQNINISEIGGKQMQLLVDFIQSLSPSLSNQDALYIFLSILVFGSIFMLLMFFIFLPGQMESGDKKKQYAYLTESSRKNQRWDIIHN